MPTDATPGCGGASEIMRVIERRFRIVSRHFPMFPVISGRIATRKMAAKADIGRAMENTMTDVAEAHTLRRATAASVTIINRWVEHD